MKVVEKKEIEEEWKKLLKEYHGRNRKENFFKKTEKNKNIQLHVTRWYIFIKFTM